MALVLMNSSHSSLLMHVVILIILGHLLVRKFSLVAEGKSLRLPSIPELFRSFRAFLVLTLTHFTRLMTYMPFCIMAMAHSLCQDPAGVSVNGQEHPTTVCS